VNEEENVIIDADFVKENYTKSDSRIIELENCDRAIVLVPELANLTAEFCKELNTFFDFIGDNKIVSDFFKQKNYD